MTLYLGLLAGVLQLVGYLIYVRDEEIEPNPVTWLMFAYGTMLLTMLEWDRQASAAGARASRSSAAAWRSTWRAAAGGVPTGKRSLALLAARMVARGLAGPRLLPGGPRPDRALPRRRRFSPTSRWIGEGAREVAVVVFLIGANLTTLTAFFPLIRSVVEDPSHERTAPWAVWATAYALLGVTTYAMQGEIWSELMLYPALNTVLHGSVAVLSRRSRRERHARRESRAPVRRRRQRRTRRRMDRASRRRTT